MPSGTPEPAPDFADRFLVADGVEDGVAHNLFRLLVRALRHRIGAPWNGLQIRLHQDSAWLQRLGRNHQSGPRLAICLHREQHIEKAGGKNGYYQRHPEQFS
jgi:hypothetical protein